MDLAKEKLEWLKSIGAIEQRWKNCRWYVPDTKMHYSEEYIKNTPLAELKAKHERNLSFGEVGKSQE